jgi:hypothetical protein
MEPSPGLRETKLLFLAPCTENIKVLVVAGNSIYSSRLLRVKLVLFLWNHGKLLVIGPDRDGSDNGKTKGE